MTALGVVLFCSVVVLLLYFYRSAPRRSAFPFYGYAGIAILVLSEILMFANVEPVATYFTAIAWTAYILTADAAVYSLRAKSLLRNFPSEFAWIAVLSIPLWLIFEAYNLRLVNWAYVGVPLNWFARTCGYAWAFATIWPAIFETADFVGALRGNRNRDAMPSPICAARYKEADAISVASNAPRRQEDQKHMEAAPGPEDQSADPPVDLCAQTAVHNRRILGLLAVIVGALFLVLPLVMPAPIRPYLFGAVWLGFIFLLEPINYRIGAPSLWRDLERGRRSRLISLLIGGAICGIFWEFWNFWAHARWVYVFPILQQWKIFAMPLPGYLGFPAFAVECFEMFALLVVVINGTLSALGVQGRFRREALDL